MWLQTGRRATVGRYSELEAAAAAAGFSSSRFSSGNSVAGLAWTMRLRPVALRLVKSIVGELEEQVDTIGGFVEGGDANGDGHPVRGALFRMGAVLRRRVCG